ncbi:MAG: segregation/condensation protein A [Candidatus Firestonebacteria bacterium]
MYNVVSKKYEGPFEILLDLIKEEEIDVSQVTVLDIVKGFELTNIDEGSEFILYMANLIYLKSESLLPNVEDTKSTEENVDMEKLLQEYRKFKEVSKELETKEIKQRDFFYKEEDFSEFVEKEFKEATLYDLLFAFKSVLAYLPKDEVVNMAREGVTVKQKINEILDVLDLQEKIQFIDFLKKQLSKEHVITTFLAILELIKLGLIICKQSMTTHEIYILRK